MTSKHGMWGLTSNVSIEINWIKWEAWHVWGWGEGMCETVAFPTATHPGVSKPSATQYAATAPATKNNGCIQNNTRVALSAHKIKVTGSVYLKK